MKIDKKTAEELKLLAKQLPRMVELDSLGNEKYQFGTFKEKGKALLEANPNMKGPDGKPIQPDQFYKVKRLVFINHEKEILKAYALKGPAGVETYCKNMVEARRNWDRKQLSIPNLFKRTVKKIKAAIAENNRD